MSNQKTSDHYDTYAREYEQRWKGYLKNTHNKLLEALIPDLEPDDRILDVSCGTGLLAKELLEQNAPFRELVLNDISPRMLGIAQARLPTDFRLSYTSYPAEELQFDQNRFTKVICLNAFHNYHRPSVAARRFKDVLTPDGRLFLLDWNRSGWFRLINTAIQLTGKETIRTRNLKEIRTMLNEHQFNIDYTDQWNYSYWRLFLVVAGFQPWRKFHLCSGLG